MSVIHHLESSVLIVVLVCCLGCGGAPRRIAQPKFNSHAGADAVKAYDKNSDGAISDQELDNVPALRAAIGSVDTDKDSKVSAAEIDGRIQQWRKSRVGRMPVVCEVMLDGQPLAGAVIVLEPESFLGSNLPSGQGTTNENGIAGITIPVEQLSDPSIPGMPCGWYKIRVTSSDPEIPEIYNTQTPFGCEVANYAHWLNDGAVKLKLKSK